ncbi:MAG TPA: hypothetical protein PKL99_08860 [Syntrophales bacterium]|jgi:hypothetical protein|nr:hypothetical protein [Thermotogaceae bacterium]HNT57980.1 hypothetical protein [Syntrophales bacterium]
MEEQNRLTDRIERKVSLARERDTRVIITRTSDTHRVLDIVRSADKAIRILRNGLLIRFTTPEVLPLLEDYQKAVEGLNRSAARICDKAGVPYRPPKGMESREDGAEAEEKGKKK